MDIVRKRKGGVDASFFEDVNMIPHPSEHDASQKTVLVLDDVMLGQQNKAETYFTRGRHTLDYGDRLMTFVICVTRYGERISIISLQFIYRDRLILENIERIWMSTQYIMQWA